jgi:acetyl esterase/lipase
MLAVNNRAVNRRLAALALMSLALFSLPGCFQENLPVAPSATITITPPPVSAPALSPVSPLPGPPAAKLGTVERDIVYTAAGAIPQKMDIYYPRAATKAAPALLYVHGGGWTGGNKGAGNGTVDTQELVSRGYLVAAIDYRLAPQYLFPAQIEDVKCAVRFLRENAALLGIDPARIGAWGGSAGAHLVALLGTAGLEAGMEGTGGYAGQSSRVQAVVDLFGPADLTVFFGPAGKLLEVFGTTDPRSEAARRASPVSWITPDDPPFLIIHGDQDATVPLSQSRILYDRLQAAGVPATLVVVKNGGHSFVPVGGAISPSRTEITKMIADFFDRTLR